MQASVAENVSAARKMILDLIAENATVCIGDSSTVRQVEIVQALKNRGTSIINPFDTDNRIVDEQTFFESLVKPMIKATVGDVYLTGTNALTEDGRLFNIDGWEIV